MEFWTQTFVPLVIGALSSSGMWAYLQKRSTVRSATTQLVLGLAHDRIIHLGMGYIDRGYITKDEYEDYMKYLVSPYTKFGGNGLAEKVVESVKALPITRRANVQPPTKEIYLGDFNPETDD